MQVQLNRVSVSPAVVLCQPKESDSKVAVDILPGYILPVATSPSASLEVDSPNRTAMAKKRTTKLFERVASERVQILRAEAAVYLRWCDLPWPLAQSGCLRTALAIDEYRAISDV